MQETKRKYTFTIPESAFRAAIPRMRPVITKVTTSDIYLEVAALLDDALCDARRDGRVVEIVDAQLEDHTAVRYVTVLRFGELRLVAVIGDETRRYFREFSGISGKILLTVKTLSEAHECLTSGEWLSVDGTQVLGAPQDEATDDILLPPASSPDVDDIAHVFPNEATDARVVCPGCKQPRPMWAFHSGGRPRGDGQPALSETCKGCRVEASRAGKKAVQMAKEARKRRPRGKVAEPTKAPDSKLMQLINEERDARQQLVHLADEKQRAARIFSELDSEITSLDEQVARLDQAIRSELEQLRALPGSTCNPGAQARR